MTLNSFGADDLRNYFLFWKDVIDLTESSEATLRRAIKRNEFPAPVSLFGNKGRVGFRRSDVLLWCERRTNKKGGI
tara:strand:+ start:296 stop:523 length:228 start_codon:yes stop_codon:yes gene_type:complete